MSSKNQTEVVIIGAGLAGLTAAMMLQEAGVSFVVLEARDRAGGRVFSRSEAGVIIDYGAQWVTPKQHRVFAMLDRLGLTTTPTFTNGSYYSDIHGRERRSAKEIPPAPVTSLLDIARARRQLNKQCKDINAAAPWESASALSLDTQTAGSWADRCLLTKYGKAFCSMRIKEGLCGELSDFSMLDLIWSLASCGGLKAVSHGEDYWITEGAQALPDRMAASLGGAVILGAPARKIVWGEQGAEVFTDQESWSCRRIIAAMPPFLTSRIEYDPPLPFMREQLSQRVGMGAVMKFIIVYTKPFWREQGLNGSASIDSAPIITTIDSSPPGQAIGVLTAIAAGKDARALGLVSPDERRGEVLRCLAGPFGSEALRPLAFYEHDWLSDPWTRGGYGAHFAPGVISQFGPSLLKSIGPIHWAGTETAAEWRYYMEGAMQSGERAALEVIQAISSQQIK